MFPFVCQDRSRFWSFDHVFNACLKLLKVPALQAALKAVKGRNGKTLCLKKEIAACARHNFAVQLLVARYR